MPTLTTNYTYRKTRHFKGYPSPYLRGHTPGRFKSGADSHRWRGGRIQRRGYVLLHMPNHPAADVKGYVPEHRIVIERLTGRRLEPFEHVHHINGDGTDNRPENLVVLTINEHTALHGSKTFRDYHASHPGKRAEAGRKGAAARWGKPT